VPGVFFFLYIEFFFVATRTTSKKSGSFAVRSTKTKRCLVSKHPQWKNGLKQDSELG
jgi:hypothetical protein